MFPRLHQDVLSAILGTMIPPGFNNDDDGVRDANKTYSTNVRGDFRCNNPSCGLAIPSKTAAWSSKRVAIAIRTCPNNEYNAAVYYQRCRSCDKLGVLDLDDTSYVDRVAYRLRKWAGVKMELPPYDGKRGPPHKWELCEGCKAGYCHKGSSDDED
jgi:hypothetical protein